jgi:cell division initiation protein
LKITPLDIQKQQFKGKMLGGLDPEDVDAFLQTIAQEMENLVRENSELKEQQRRATQELEEMARQEGQLRETMLAAQKITEEMKNNAQKEATLIISEAELKAERIVADAEKSLSQLNGQIQELKRQKFQFEISLKSLLDNHSKMLSFNDE